MLATKFPQITIKDHTVVQGTYQKSVLLTKGFLTRKSNTLFLANKENTFSGSSLKNSKYKVKGYLLEILLHGLNYSAKRVKRFRPSFILDLHKSETLICLPSIASPVKFRIHKRRLIFFSHDRQLLHNIEKTIKEFKLPNIYTGKGLFSRNDSYKLKKGKKR
jgi:hypothetical protein